MKHYAFLGCYVLLVHPYSHKKVDDGKIFQLVTALILPFYQQQESYNGELNCPETEPPTTLLWQQNALYNHDVMISLLWAHKPGYVRSVKLYAFNTENFVKTQSMLLITF